MERKMKSIGDHRYVAVLLPYDNRLKIDEAAYRRSCDTPQ